MDSKEHMQNVASTNVMGDHNTIHNTLHVTVNLDSRSGMGRTESTQTNRASGDASHLGSYNESTQTNRASGGASHLASYNESTQTSRASGGASHLGSYNESTQTNRAPGGASHLGSYNESTQTNRASSGASHLGSYNESTQTNRASGGASHLASYNESTQTNRAPGGASHLGSYNVNNGAEMITDEAKRNAEVKEIEITWLAKEVSKNGRFYSKKDSLYRHLNISDQECVRIKQERLDRSRSTEDEIFKVVNLGWQPLTKTRGHLIKQLFTFDKKLAKAYADYINICDDFDIGLPLQLPPLSLPGTLTTSSCLPTSPSIQGPSSLPALLSPTDVTALAFNLNSLSIQGPMSVNEGQLVQPGTLAIQEGSSSIDGGQDAQSNTLPSHIFMLLGADVSEDEITWLSSHIAGGHHFRERNSLYRHLKVPDSEVDKIKYEKLSEERSIENEIFKVIYHGWYLQGESRARILFCRQLLTFNKSLAEDYLKYLNDQVGNVS